MLNSLCIRTVYTCYKYMQCRSDHACACACACVTKHRCPANTISDFTRQALLDLILPSCQLAQLIQSACKLLTQFSELDLGLTSFSSTRAGPVLVEAKQHSDIAGQLSVFAPPSLSYRSCTQAKAKTIPAPPPASTMPMHGPCTHGAWAGQHISMGGLKAKSVNPMTGTMDHENAVDAGAPQHAHAMNR